MARFVIVVDTQRDFMAADGALSVSGAEPLVGAMGEWLAALDPADTAGVLFTFDTHLPEVYQSSTEAEAFPIHCVRGSEGWANMLDLTGLDPAIPVYRMEKGVFDMWAETGLLIQPVCPATGPTHLRDAFFAALKEQSVTDVTVIGVAADYCVRWAIAGLVVRGFTVSVPERLTRGIERQIDQVIKEDFRHLPVSAA